MGTGSPHDGWMTNGNHTATIRVNSGSNASGGYGNMYSATLTYYYNENFTYPKHWYISVG